MDELYANNQKQKEELTGKQTEERYMVVDRSLKLQKDQLQAWTQDEKNQEEYRATSRSMMEAINKAFTEKLSSLYGVTQVAPTVKKDLKQTIPVAKSWWWSRAYEESTLKKARRKYGNQISVNSIREQKAMQEFEELRNSQINGYQAEKEAYTSRGIIKVNKTALQAGELTLDVKIDGYEEIVSRQKLDKVPDHYSRSEEIEKGLTAFFGMQKTSWLFWKRTVGALGNETAEEKRDVNAYNKRLLRQYTTSEPNSKARTALLNELRWKIQSFKITPEMLGDGYLADNAVKLWRFVDMTKAFRVLIATNPGYLERLPEEDRIMLGNTLNYTGPLIRDFLEKHQACKHLGKKRGKTVLTENATEDRSARNESLMKETLSKLRQADMAEQTRIGLNNKKVVQELNRQKNEAQDRRENEKALPDYAVVLQYDTSGASERRLLAMQDKIRDRSGAYDLIGRDMEKLFGQLSKTMITIDTIKARKTALEKAVAQTKAEGKRLGMDRRQSAFVAYAEQEIQHLQHDWSLLEVQAAQYECTLNYVTGIRFSEDDMMIPPMKEGNAEIIQKVLKAEKLSFLMHLEDCRFYAKEFTEISGGVFQFRAVMKDAVSRARGEEMRLHTEKLAELEKNYKNHKLETYQILALKPEDLEKYNYDGYTDKDGHRHQGAHDLTDEENFRHMKEIASIAGMDLEKAKAHLRQVCEESNNTAEETEERLLDLETKYKLFKDYGKKWEGTYTGVQTEAYRYLPQVPDMEGQNGTFQDPRVFRTYKEKLQKKLEEKEKNVPDSPDIRRYREMISLMDAMMIRNGLLFEGDEDIRLLNAQAYHARYKQVKYEKRLNKALKTFVKLEDATDRKKLLMRADDALFFEDQYAELQKHYGRGLNRNLLQEMLDNSLKNVEDEEEKAEVTRTFYANMGVTLLEFRQKLTPEFFTRDYIRNHFDDFAKTILTIRDFGRMISSQKAFDQMMDGLSGKNRDEVGQAADVMLQLSGQLQHLLFSVFSANSVNYETGTIYHRHNLIQMELQLMPENELAKQYQETAKTLQDKRNAKKEARKTGANQTDTLDQINEELTLANKGMKIINQAKEFTDDLAEDFLDHNLTMQLKKFRDLDTLLGSDSKKMLFDAKSPTEELYRFLYTDKDSKDLSFAGDKESWENALKKAENKTGILFGLFTGGLTEEARNVAKEMQKDPKKIEDYLQWKVRQDSRRYMNERSKMLGVKESQADTNVALEIMDSMEETHSAVHNSVNLKMRLTLFPELEQKGIDPEQFMHLLRIVHRNTSGMAERMVDITNQSDNMNKTTLYMDPKSKGDFILQVSTDVMELDITENMLTEEYLKKPGNFRYMYFMVQKLKAYEQLYQNDREAVQAALGKHKELLKKVNERFGTFYGNLSDQVYQLVMNFAAKYGVDQNGARTFGLSGEEYENLTEEKKTKEFAKQSRTNMAKADEQFRENTAEIQKIYARQRTAVAAVSAIQKYRPFEVEHWLRKKPEITKDAFRTAGFTQQVKDNQMVLSGMENAITLQEKETEQRKPAKKKVKKLDNRFSMGDIAYLLPEQAYREKLQKDRESGNRNKEMLDLVDLFSGNAVRQMNYLLAENHLEEFLKVFRKNQNISASSGQDLSSEDYLAKNFSEELYLDAKKMAVCALLPTIIPDLFKDGFVETAQDRENQAPESEEYLTLTETIENLQEQSQSITKDTRNRIQNQQITQEDQQKAEVDMVMLGRRITFAEQDRERLLPKLRTEEQKSSVKAQLKELKKYIGSAAQREFYKNFADNLQRYARLCGVNTESPENSLGSFLSGMSRERIDMSLDSMKSGAADRRNALNGTMS